MSADNKWLSFQTYANDIFNLQVEYSMGLKIRFIYYQRDHYICITVLLECLCLSNEMIMIDWFLNFGSHQNKQIFFWTSFISVFLVWLKIQEQLIMVGNFRSFQWDDHDWFVIEFWVTPEKIGFLETFPYSFPIVFLVWLKIQEPINHGR